MRAIDIIEKTQHKIELTEKEIQFLIDSYVKGKTPDYQISAWLMAVYFNSLTIKELHYLTKAMLHSGDIIDLSSIKGLKVDKHSTGGVGDKTTLIIAPLAASCGCVMAKLSGRGLGHTGGTLDKLESIPGVSVNFTEEQFIKQVKDINVAVIGQTQNLVPADKLLYALRDVTCTVESLPLIASSVMSKKLASGTDVICLDVKFGNGAFMKTKERAIELSHLMIDIAKAAKKHAVCFVSDMNHPLGYGIGNRIEVLEAIDCLKNKGPKAVTDICTEIVSYMVYYSGIKPTLEESTKFVLSKLEDGSAYNKFIEMIKAQGATIDSFDNFVNVKEIIPLYAKESGYIKEINALTMGLCSMRLGAGREQVNDPVDPNVGIILSKKIGDYVNKGDKLLDIYKNDKFDDELIDDLYGSYSFSDKPIDEESYATLIIE